MLATDRFGAAYAALAAGTDGFRDIDVETIASVLVNHPSALAPLRMITGLTLKELAVAVRLASGTVVSDAALRTWEREPGPPDPESVRARRRAPLVQAVAEAVVAVIGREILTVPPAAAASFHSKLDKSDTSDGWKSVARVAADGVPYSELLYQRYVGGVWRQVQDAYSEVKGDAILEVPVETLLLSEKIPHWRSRRGATGAGDRAALRNRSRSGFPHSRRQPGCDCRDEGCRGRRECARQGGPNSALERDRGATRTCDLRRRRRQGMGGAPSSARGCDCRDPRSDVFTIDIGGPRGGSRDRCMARSLRELSCDRMGGGFSRSRLPRGRLEREVKARPV